MNRRSDIIGIFALSIALLGILVLQFYWIGLSVKSKEDMFSQSVLQALNRAGRSVEEKEMSEYIARFMSLMENDSLSKMKDTQIKEFVFVKESKDTKEMFIYTQGVLNDNYTLPLNLLKKDSLYDLTLRKILSKQQHRSIHRKFLSDSRMKSPSISYKKLSDLAGIDKAIYEETFKQIARGQPLSNRLSRWQLDFFIRQYLLDRGIKMDFEFAVLRNGAVTSVRTKNFSKDKWKRYTVPIFRSDDQTIRYELAVVFPNRTRYLLASTIGMAALSVALILLMIFIFIRGIMQITKQKQISEIKTDFINNMTHEFKTPIATINLALDAMKNPMVNQSPEKLQFYMKMIRDENKRMHAQVENVLRISKFDKNQINIDKERFDVHDLIDSALEHTHLLLEEKNGKVKKHLKAIHTEILANDLHFTSVLVNILENAIKYSSESPQIDIYTENVKNSVLIKIQDKGIGMSKTALKRAFDKFYREHTGDIHNVKGHGLGLAYAKRIVADHHGEVYAESEKGKGSIFYIKVPVIY